MTTYYVSREYDNAVLCNDGQWRVDPSDSEIKRYKRLGNASRFGLTRIAPEFYVKWGGGLCSTIGTIHHDHTK